MIVPKHGHSPRRQWLKLSAGALLTLGMWLVGAVATSDS